MNIEVSKDNVKITNKEQIHKGEYQANECNFTFSEEYSGLVKKAIFENREEAIEILLVNDKCHIPNEILLGNSIEVNLRVYGYEVEEENGESTLKLRYSPAYTTFMLNRGSYLENTSNTEPITPTDKEQMEQIVTDAINEIDGAVEEVNTAVVQVNTAINEVNHLDLDVNKVDKTATVEITKKDNTTKSVNIYDGVSLQFMWSGTSLGIKTDNDSQYTFVNLQGARGPIGPQGEPFRIKRTYPSVEAMDADFDNMNYGDYVMIASSVEIQDNAKLYTKGEVEWIFITDFSGATGIRGETGATPSIQIGTVTSGESPSVTRTGTDEEPILNFILEKGEKGDTGNTGATGATGNGVVGIAKTSTSGLVDTYTMTYTNGNTDTFDVTNGQDGEVTQAQLDEVQADLDRYKTIENALPHITGEGEAPTLNNTADSVLHLNLKGNTSQSGEPTPSSPQPIHIVSGDNTIKVQNKNLYDKNDTSNVLIGTYIASDKIIKTMPGTRSIYISCRPNTTYTISKIASTRFRVGTGTSYALNTTLTNIETDLTGTELTITSGNNDKYLVIFYYYGESDTLTAEEIRNSIQVEINNQATTYIKHQEQTQLISLGSLWLGKISTYQDYFYKSSGKWYLHKELGKVVYNGSETGWDISGVSNSTFNINKPNTMNTGETNMLSNYFSDFKTSVTQLGDYGIVVGSKVNIKNIDITDDDLDGFKTWLSTHNTELYYPLATSTNTEITDTTLIGQLDNIEKLMSYNSQTNISQVNNDLPFVISASALKDISNL